MKQFTSREALPGLKFSIFMLTISIGAMSLWSPGVMAQQVSAKNKIVDQAKIVTPEMVAALQKRVKSLEAQLVDLRAMIGTFASLRGSPNGSQVSQPPAPGSASSDLPPSANLPWQGKRSQNRLNSARTSGGDALGRPGQVLPGPATAPNGQQSGPSSDQLASRGRTEAEAVQPRPDRGNSERPNNAAGAPAAETNNSNAQTLYKDAYSHMLRRDYASAESAFGALLKNHPQSRMAGNAQYWLGETYYVRGKYRPAADAFLKAYRKYATGIKAPDSLMKLALSLTRLGQKSAACRTFQELETKYPNAPNHVKQRAGMERRRAGCN